MEDIAGIGASLSTASSPASASRKDSSCNIGDEVHQGQEMRDAMNFHSTKIDRIEIDGIDDESEKKLWNLEKKRDELQQMEIQLRTDMRVRSAIVEMKNNLDSQIKEPAALREEPQVQIDGIGGLDDDSAKKLQSLEKKRVELQQMEIQLRADMIARSAIVEMKNNFDSQIKESAGLRSELQEQLDEREQRIIKLHALILDYEATWAKEDSLKEQNKKIANFRREHDDTEAERAMKQIHCFQEHIPKKSRQVSFPDAAVEHLFSLISSIDDRNSISLVCKHWYSLERHSRRCIFIRNSKNISPLIISRRFTNVRSLIINGNISPPSPPRSLALPWISMLVTHYPKMEEIIMTNMVVTDADFLLIGGNFKNLRDLKFCECIGYSTVGLSSITANCRNLRKLHLADIDLDDVGLSEIVAPCKELQDLNIRFVEENSLTEQGLLSIVMSCPMLHSIEYECTSMTNATLLTIADQLPNLLSLGISLTELSIDHLTNEPFDIGFATILERCKNLKLLLISGLVIIERLLESIGTYGKKLETLCLFFVMDFDWGLHHVVSGCTNLKSLLLEECEFGDQALLAIGTWPETLESLLMWPSRVKYRVCKLLKERYPKLIIEVNDEKMPLLEDMADDSLVESLHIYRSNRTVA